MQLMRVVFPAAVGGLFLLVGVQSVLSGFQPGSGDGVVGAVRTGLIPIGVGIGLLLATLAISRRILLGWLLGQVVAVLMVLGGLSLIVAEIPYLDDGGLGTILAVPFMIIAGVWSVLWAVYGWRLYKAQATFAPDWQANDRRLGIVIGGLAVFVGAAWYSLGAMQGVTVAQAEAGFARAQALVAATTFDVTGFEPTLDPSSGTGSAQEVERLTLDLTLASPESYGLLESPTLCLTDSATFKDPAYKPDIICWGTTGQALVLASDFPNMSVPAGRTMFRVELARAGSPCAFPVGEWTAALTLAPRVDDVATGAIGPAPERFTLDARFLVGPDEVAPLPSGTVPAGLACLGVSP